MPTCGTPTSHQLRPHTRWHPHCLQPAPATRLSPQDWFPAHHAPGAAALPCQVRVTNHPPGVSTRGHLFPRSPGLVALWPGLGARARGWRSGSSTQPPGWSVALGWWLCPVSHPVAPTPGAGSSRQPPRCLFFQPLGIFLARAVCSQVVQEGKGQLCWQEPWPTPSSQCGRHRLAPAQTQRPPMCHRARHREWHRSHQYAARGTALTGWRVPWHAVGCWHTWRMHVLANAPSSP